jgi:hypothetical protein
MHTGIHALSGIQTHDPSVRASEDGSCLRPRGHCDRHGRYIQQQIQLRGDRKTNILRDVHMEYIKEREENCINRVLYYLITSFSRQA